MSAPQSFEFDGRAIPFRAGQTVGGALTAVGVRAWRTTRRAGRPRGLFCGIGICYDCLITVNGVPGQRACLVPARAGDVLTSTDPSRPVGEAEPGGAPAPDEGPGPDREQEPGGKQEHNETQEHGGAA